MSARDADRAAIEARIARLESNRASAMDMCLLSSIKTYDEWLGKARAELAALDTPAGGGSDV